MADRVVSRVNRPERVPLGQRNVLTAPQKEGYVRRFVNDEGDRIKDFEAAGYSIVTEDINVGDPKAGKDTKIGSAVNPSVGQGTRAVLMEIKKEWHEEDQKAKQDKITAGEDDMKRTLNQGGSGQYGGVKIS